MSISMRAWISALALAAGLGLPTPAAAQKALVYCPVSIDAAGCGAIVTALGAEATLFPGGIDGAYDGSQGTVDLATVDLAGYAAFLVPSLADGAGTTPYALLRDPTISGRLKAGFMGRVAVWSGTPDVGSTNRAAKDALIRNLARWVRPDSAGSHGPGVVVLQDNSDDAAARYGWVSGISGGGVAADSTFTVYSNVQALTQAGVAILTSGGTQIGYSNMASFALLPDVGTNSDATGGRTSAVVLATVAGEPSNPNIATVQTDREDYFPPDTVIITGAGWEPGETVTLRIQEDVSPPTHPATTLTTTADGAGHILDQQFEIDSTAIGVRFTLTATGQSSGRTAQATFTDATGLNSVTMLGVQTPAPINPGGSVTYGTAASNSVQVRFNGNGSCTVTLSVSGLPAGATATFAPSTLTGTSSGNQFTLLSVNTSVSTPTGTSTLTVRATGTGGGGNDCSTSTTQTATTTLVVKRTSTTTVTGPASSTFGGSVTFTATIGGGPSPTGTVQFKDGAANLGAPQTVSGGTASLSTSALTSGAHTITAVYSGDANFGGSTSPNFSHTVNPASTTTVLSSSINPSTFGQSISLSATVTGPSGLGTPTGSIQFRIDGSDFGSPVALSGGSATSGSTNSLAVGSHPVAAVYTPDAASAATFSGSTSTVIATQTVNQALSTTTLVSSVNPSVFGQSVTLTATVKNGATPITIGSIGFIEGGTCATPGTTLQGSQTPNGSGVVTYTTAAFSVAAHSILACYDGSGSFGPSQAPLTQTVTKAATTTTITSDTPDPSNVGAAVAVNFTVTVNSPGSGTPTGNVTVSASGGTETCTGTVAAGTCSITLNASGVRTLTATYASDPNFNGSTSATAAHTVNAPSTVLTVAPASGTFGGTAALSATLTSSGNPVSGKSISFTLNGSSAGSATTNASGVASIAAANLGAINAGSYPTGVAASFAGDAGFTASNGTNSLTVNKATVTVTVTVIPASIAYGSVVELDADLSPGLSGRTISFDIAGTPVGTANTDGSGKAKLMGVNPATFGINTGTFTVTASFPTEQNYDAATGTGTLTITPKSVTPVITVSNKVYDGTTAATILTRTLTGVVGTDDVTLTGGTASFATKTVGTAKTVTGTGFTLAGADAGNYVLSPSTASTTANITAVTLTGQITANSKGYDGTTTATLASRTLTGVIGGDVVTLTGGTATFDTKNVGTGKTVTATGLTLSGADAGNYLLASSTLTTTADITSATVTGHFTASNKTYDGTTAATILTRTLTGVVSGETATLTGGTATFDTKDVGTAKNVTGTGFTLGGADAANYVLASTTLTTTADITPVTLTGQITANNRGYDGTTAATLATRTLTGVLAGDVVTLTGGTATFDTKDIGTGKTVTATGLTLAGADAGNYLLASATLTTAADITVAALTGHITASNKEYDGTTAATILTRTLTGVVSGETVTLTGGTATFDTKDVGTGKTVTGTGFTLTGTDAGNYELAATSITTTADITPVTLTGHITANSKTYDGTTAATLATRTLTGVLAGDVVSLTGGTATFDTKHIGTGKTVTATGLVLSGADAGNYVLGATTLTTTADVTSATLTGHFTAENKLYDGTTDATIATRTLTGVVSGETVTLTGGTATFDTKDVGTGKTVTGTGFSLAGADAGNYVLASSTLTTTGDITSVTLTGHITANNKVYDGTTAATLATRTLTGVIGTDDVSLTGGTASFADKHVGTGKTVTATGVTLSGSDAGNYVLASTTLTATADITVRTLTATATAENKVYDGTTAASIALGDDRVAGDAVTLSSVSATFDTRNVGNGKTVTVTGVAIGGADAGNYVLASTTVTTTADITPATVTGQFTASNRIYDGTTAATIATRTLIGVLGTDDVSLSSGTAAFADKHVANGKTVTGTGFVLAGTDAGNYQLASTTLTTTADITERTLTVTATGQNRVYDATDAATVTLQDDRVAGDVFSVTSASPTFADKNVGNGKAVSVTGIAIGSGADAGNYHLGNTSTSTTADITPASLAPHITATGKVYDGTTSATIATRTLTVVLASDVVSLTSGTASFADKDVGTGKTVTGTGFVLAGADAGNYILDPASATTTADITPRVLVATATGHDRVYDATMVATVTLGDDRVAGDGVTLGYTGASFATKDVGGGKPVSVSGISITGGADAGNYHLSNSTASTTASITPASLAPHITATGKVYDGTTSATIATRSLTGILASDLVTLSGGTASFADKNAAANKTVTGSGFSLAGADAGNYVLDPLAATTTTDITARPLTATATGHDRVYDAGIVATVTLSDDRVAADDLTLGYTGAAFATKGVGTAKPVSVSGIAISGGTDAGNYELGNTTASTTASITPASLAPHIAASDKVYDGNANAAITSRTLTGILASDDVSLTGGTASFADKNVGATKTVTGSGFTLAGADAGNYLQVPNTATTTAAITRRDLAATATGHDKIYDATAVAAVTLGDDRVAGDDLTLSHTGASFGTKHVGTGKPVSVSGIAISGGADAGNYHLTNTSAPATVSITPASLAPHFTADNKVYDGGTTGTILTRSVTVVLGTDDVSLTLGTATFADKNVGTSKTVTGTGFVLGGTDAGNYQLAPTTATTTASISQRPVAVAADAKTKVYGDADPSLTYHVTGDPLVAGDGFTGVLTRGAGETVPASPYAINQGTLTAGGNYALAFTGASLAVTPATLTVTAGNAIKKFGDAVPAPLTGNIAGIKFTDNIAATYTAYVATGGLALVTPTTPVAGSPYPIIPLVSGLPSGVLANYTVVPVNGGLTVQKATPSFNSLVIPNVVVGQSSSTVSGNLKYLGTAGTVFPSGAASITVNGQTQPATIQANGSFTATFNTAAFPPSGAGHAVSLSYNGSDPNFTVASGAGAMKVLYSIAAGHQFLQPINPNLTTGNRSSFKIGSTIPTKFQLFKADGTTAITSAVATIAIMKLDNNAETPINEELITSPADDGINFRVSSGQYIYNLSTKNWTAGTYKIIANLDDGSQITAEVDGRSK